MSKIKIGIIKEGKIPIDKRVPLTPGQVKQLCHDYPELSIVVQSSDIRCFRDEDYLSEGIQVVDDVSDCDVLLGVKEVPIDQLIKEKTYFFFSHTIKKQPYNRKLLQSIVDKKIRLIDYETLTDSEGKRIIAFGRWAGIVGAYNGIRTYGMRYRLFEVRKAADCFDLQDLISEFDKIKLPPIKIVLTGGGRVAKGTIEVLMAMGIHKISPYTFLNERFDTPVFTQLNARDYHLSKSGGLFSRNDFFRNPEKYESIFIPFAEKADLLIAAAYWDPKSPVLFRREDILSPAFNIKVVADITCDIEGSIPCTKQASTIENPVYDYNPEDDKIEKAYSDEGNISVMAVDNLPCELSRDASHSFGEMLSNEVIPHLLGDDQDQIIQRATITQNGSLTSHYIYLTDYLNGE